MRRVERLACAALALAAVGCGGFSYQSDFDTSANFSGLQTYRWAERTAEGSEDPRVFNPIVAGRVRNAVNKALQAKGFREATSGTPDFYVSWHGAIDGKMSYSTINHNYGYGWGWYGRGYGGAGMGMSTSTTQVNEWDEGTLIVGIVDPGSNELIWWGSANGELSKTKRPPDEAQRKADEVAAKILEGFPPGSEG